MISRMSGREQRAEEIALGKCEPTGSMSVGIQARGEVHDLR
jgi:hypothetical protein